MVQGTGPWGTGPYKLIEGFSLPDKRSDKVVLEANTEYWDKTRFPRLKRIVFDNTLSQKEALELVRTTEGQVDLVSEISPQKTLQVAQSPFARVVKNRGSLGIVFGYFNMRKAESPWRDARVRQAVNFAINREDLIYTTRGNGVIIPAVVSIHSFGYNPDLTPYPFDPAKARQLLRDARYPDGLPITLMASEDLEVQATMVTMMLDRVGFQVDLQILDPIAYNQKTLLSHLDQPAEQQAWDITLVSQPDTINFPVFEIYHWFALDGPHDWLAEQPELRQLYEEALHTVDLEKQQALIQQMEWHTSEQAYFLFLYSPIQLYAVNKAVEFVPYVTTVLDLAETSVTDQHWSVQKTTSQKAPPETQLLRADPENADQVALGKSLYAQHCANNCHGANLEGQPNWKAAFTHG
ncbi:MAG: ABC transporter substrate-binding protein [Nitrospira sp.]|nr:ABC transporter substrate-binding protein [Nitrospira sp.]